MFCAPTAPFPGEPCKDSVADPNCGDIALSFSMNWQTPGCSLPFVQCGPCKSQTKDICDTKFIQIVCMQMCLNYVLFVFHVNGVHTL